MGYTHYFASWFQKLVDRFDVSLRSYLVLLRARTLPQTAISWTSITCEASSGKVKTSIKGTIISFFFSCLGALVFHASVDMREIMEGDFKQI